MEKEAAEEGEINDDDDDLECLGVFQKPPPNVIAEVFLCSSDDELEGESKSPPEKKPKVSTLTCSEDSTKLKELIKAKAQIEEQLGKVSDQKDGPSTSTSVVVGGSGSVERQRNSSSSSAFLATITTSSSSSSHKKLEDGLKKIELKINKLKCREFLLLIIRKAGDQKYRRIMLELIQNLIDGSIQPRQFTNRLDDFKFKATPMLTEFLENNLQELRNDMIDGSFTINGIQAPLFSNVDVISRTSTSTTTTSTINNNRPIAIVKHHNKCSNHDSSVDNSNTSTSTSTSTHTHAPNTNHNISSNNHNNLSVSSTTSLLPAASSTSSSTTTTHRTSSASLPTSTTTTTTTATTNASNNTCTHKNPETVAVANVNRSSSSSSHHSHSHSHSHEKSNKNTPSRLSLESRISQDANNMTPETSTPASDHTPNSKKSVSLERVKEYRRIERSIGTYEGEIKSLTDENLILTKRKEYIGKRLEYLKNKVKSKKQELKDI